MCCYNLTFWAILTTFTILPVFSAYYQIHLKNGLINGTDQRSYNGKLFYKFMKIPYAAPPVGELRFKAPVPPTDWNYTLDATNLDVVCYQTESDAEEESEDCLFLNVYTPELPGENKEVSLPVLFHIHGGGFVTGSSRQDIRGPEFLIDYDVVIVTINYRLGPFGFLSTGDSVVPGNVGLKDQFLALQWVHDNIKLFGGDPDRITINGGSAGSASVSYHLLNKNTQGLYRAAILESGSVLCPWALDRNPKQHTIDLVKSIKNETVQDSETLFEILLNLSAEEIDRGSASLGRWVPVMEAESDEAYVTERSYVKINNGDFVKVPVLMGTNSEELLYLARIGSIALKALGEIFDLDLQLLVPEDMRVDNLDKRREIGESIRRVYCGNGTFFENEAAVIQYFSDNYFSRSIIKDADLRSPQTPVYFYQFSYDGILGNVPIAVDGADRVSHGEQTRYIWRITNNDFDNSDLSKFPEEDVLVQQRILELWTNFVKYLNPTPEPSESLQNVIWPSVRAGGMGNLLYLDIGEGLEVTNQPKGEHYKGWVELYDSLGYSDFDTY